MGCCRGAVRTVAVGSLMHTVSRRRGAAGSAFWQPSIDLDTTGRPRKPCICADHMLDRDQGSRGDVLKLRELSECASCPHGTGLPTTQNSGSWKVARLRHVR